MKNSQAKGKKILIADDITQVRKTLVKALQAAHYQVVGEATNGKQALELFKTLEPDCILMDIVMPEMSGIESIKEIMKIDREAKIIVVSGMEQDHLMMEAVNAGAKDFVLKPFRIEDVMRTLDHVLTSEEKITERAQKGKGL